MSFSPSDGFEVSLTAAVVVDLASAVSVASGVGVTVPLPVGVSPRGRSEGPGMAFHLSLGT